MIALLPCELMTFLILTILEYTPHIVVFSTPLLGIHCGKEDLILLAVTFTIYFSVSNTASSFCEIIPRPLILIGQAIFCFAILTISLSVVPTWLTTTYSYVIQASTVIGLFVEVLTLFHLVSQLSVSFSFMYENESWESTAKLVFLLVSTIAYGVSAILIYVLMNAEFQWYMLCVLIMGVVSFYFMLYKEEGNIMDASMLLTVSLAVLYLTQVEEGYNSSLLTYAQYPPISNRCNLMESNVASLLWSCVNNLSVSYRMWRAILNPITLCSITLRVLFVLIYNFYNNKEKNRDDDVYIVHEKSSTSTIWETLSGNKTFYHAMVLLMVTHTVCQSLPTDKSEDSTSSELTFQSKIIYQRFFQACMLQGVYIYSLYFSENDED